MNRRPNASEKANPSVRRRRPRFFLVCLMCVAGMLLSACSPAGAGSDASTSDSTGVSVDSASESGVDTGSAGAYDLE